MDVNLEKDLFNNETIIQKCKHSQVYAQNLYAALCNNRFFYGDKEWSCSWRYAGGIVANIRNCGEDYITFYCSGIGTDNNEGLVAESFVTDEVRLDLMKMGWEVKPYEPEDN